MLNFNKIYLDVGKDRFRLEIIVWALFKNNWQELQTIFSHRMLVKLICKNDNCVWPEHFQLMKRSSYKAELDSYSPRMNVNRSSEVRLVLDQMAKLFPGQQIHLCAMTVSFPFAEIIRSLRFFVTGNDGS